MRFALGAVAAIVSAFVPLGSPAQTAMELFERITPPALATLSYGPDGYERLTLGQLKRLRRGAEALTPEQIAANRARRVAWRIADRLRLVSIFDGNEDGTVTPEEAGWVVKADPRREPRLRQLLRDADADGDGTIAKAEAEAYARHYAETYPNLDRETGAALMAHDVDADGILTENDIRSFVSRIRGLIFGDPSQDPLCTLPEISGAHEFHLIMSDGNNAASEPPSIDIEIAGGSRAHVILATSETPVLWSFSGDPDLVARMIVTDTAIGVRGLPPGKIMVVPETPCTRAVPGDRLSHDAFLARARIKAVTGRKPDFNHFETGTYLYRP